VKTVNHNYDEYQKAVQYYKAEFFNDIGINAMTTSKKERLVTDEVNANEESVYFSFNSVIDEINGGLKKVNEKFNTNMFAVEKKFKGSESDDKLSENNDD
jgi:ribosome-associated translation inhibitor RaiA